jgi:hypothetical protein
VGDGDTAEVGIAAVVVTAAAAVVGAGVGGETAGQPAPISMIMTMIDKSSFFNSTSMN